MPELHQMKSKFKILSVFSIIYFGNTSLGHFVRPLFIIGHQYKGYQMKIQSSSEYRQGKVYEAIFDNAMQFLPTNYILTHIILSIILQ